MANVAYPPFFPAQILDGDGQPVANGSIRAAFAGSDVPAPLFSPDGTALGSSVTLNSSGEAVFCLRAGTAYKLTCLDAQGATVWVRDNVRVTTADSGMANPMEAEGDMIVGAVDGQPERLAAPANASFLRSYKNSDNVPVVKWSQLKAGANVTITDAGTQVTVAADTQTGDHKVSTDGTDAAGYLEDKVAAGTGISLTKSSGQLVVAATGADTNEVKTSASDDHPGYLQSKVLAGDLIRVDKEQTPDGDGGYTENLRLNLDARGVTAGYVPTAAGSNGAAWAAPATQPGDHQLLVSATDAAAGYLGAKLTAGSNITITPQTDGDGVQTLEVSSTGGGGGGADWDIVEPLQMRHKSLGAQFGLIMRAFYPLGPSVRSLAIALGPFQNSYYPGGTLNGEIGIYTLSPKTNGSLVESNATRIAHKSFSQTIVSPIVWASFDADVDVSDKTKVYAAALSFDRPVVGFVPYLIMSSFGTTGSTAYCGTHITSSSHISLASSMNFNQGGAGDITYWFGISSRNLG